jgi:hypothetical protein
LFGAILGAAKPALKSIIRLSGGAVHGYAKICQRIHHGLLLRLGFENLRNFGDHLKLILRFYGGMIRVLQCCDQIRSLSN